MISASRPRLAQYLEYRKVRIFFDSASSDRRRIKEAIEAYTNLLFDQSRNTIALSEFVDLVNRATADTIVTLRSMVGEKLPDGPTLTLGHAVIRAIFGCEAIRKSTNQAVLAFSDLLKAEHSHVDEFVERLGRLLRDANFADLVILELASKYFFRRGRQERSGRDWAVADRLLRAGLVADPDDVVWISRRIDIALQQRAWARASEMLSSALELAPYDPILNFQLGRLQLLRGESDHAEITLRRLLPKSTSIGDGSAVDFHPAVIDQLALAKLRLRRFDEAEGYYRINLKRQSLDPRGWLGLGRVQFERGPAFWPFALQNWGEALILQADDSVSSTGQSADRTAALIAGLFRHEVDDPVLMGSLDALLDKEPEVLAFLAPALASRKVSGRLASKFIAVANGLDDASVKRRVAQFLRARTIWSVFSSNDESLRSDTEAYVEWCYGAQVLGDYFAGAKGIYARALVRLGAKPPVRITDHAQRASEFAGIWKVLADHVGTDGYVPRYYATADELTARMTGMSGPKLTDFAIGLVWHVLDKFDSKYKKAENLLDLLRPEIGLINPGELGALDEAMPPKLSVLVDDDVYQVACRFMNGEGWRDAGTEVERSVHRNPTDAQIFQFARGGIFFRRQTESSEGRVTAYLNALPEWSRSTYELDASATAN